MNPQGRSLQPNMRGNDVELLQTELRRLGFDIPTTEIYFGRATSQAVRGVQADHGLPTTGIVDARTARVINAALDALPREGYLVRGRLVSAEGEPIGHARISVVERRIRDETVLGAGGTGEDGRFAIEYPQPDASQLPISLVVRAIGRDSAELAVSELICDAGPVETVTLVAGGETLRGPTEYSRLSSVLSRELRREQLEAVDVSEQDIDYLACKFDFSRDQIALFIIGERHARETGIGGETFYGLMRQALPTELTALIALTDDILSDALNNSIDQGIITGMENPEIRRVLIRLSRHGLGQALSEPAPERENFATLFDIAGVDQTRRQRILEQYINREGTVASFWQQLRQDPDIPDQEIDELQQTLILSTLALNHMPLVRHLTRGLQSGDLGSEVRSLSRLRDNDWRDLLTNSDLGEVIGAPEFLGEDEQQRLERFAVFLPRMMETLFPTASFAAGLERADDSGVDFVPVLRFLETNPDFEFRDARIQDYLAEHDDAMVGVPEPEQTRATLITLQRLFQVAPAFNKAQAVVVMMGNGVDSAWSIRRTGASAIIRQYGETLGRGQAEQIYTNAARRADTALYLLSQTIAFNPAWTAMIRPQLFGLDIPDLETLFGSFDRCDCSHCGSVFSPAAYLVEILHFLMNRPGDQPGRSALDVLFGRRPDIGDMELSCDNSDTRLPYVDLVLEILENAVINQGPLVIDDDDPSDEQSGDDLFPFQTIGDESSLGANPEHQSEEAYQVLREAVFPWLLPFDLWSTEIGDYLGHLGIAWYELISAFRIAGGEAAEVAIATDYLGLTQRQRELITATGGEPAHQIWGLDNNTAFDEFLDNRNAGEILARSGLSYEELIGLLEVDFIAAGDNLTIAFDNPDCDLDNARITHLSTGSLDRLHRFVRLWRTQTWSIESLDLILQTLRGEQSADEFDLDDSLLIRLATLSRLQRELKVDLPILLNWLVDLMLTRAVEARVSLYDRIFLNHSVHRPELDAFSLDGAGTELADTSASLTDHQAITSRMLGIDESEFLLLIDNELVEDSHNLGNLTRLYQAVSLAKKLHLSTNEYLSLRAMTGIDPLGFGAIDVLNQFVDTSRRVGLSPFSIAELDAMLRLQSSFGTTLDPSDEQITSLFVTLRSALFDLVRQYQLSDSPDIRMQRLEEALDGQFPPQVADRLLGIVNSSSNQSEEEQIALIEASVADFVEPATIVNSWFADQDDDRVIDAVERASMLLEPLLLHLRQQASQDLVLVKLAEALTTSIDMVEPLLRTYLTPPDGFESALEAYLSDDFTPVIPPLGEIPDIPATTNPDDLGQQFVLFRRLARTLFFLQAFELPAESLDFYFEQGVPAGWLDPNSLPTEPLDGATDQLDLLLDQAELFHLGTELFGDLSGLIELLRFLDNEQMNRSGFLLMLGALTDWRFLDLLFLTGSEAADLSYPEGFRDGRFLLSLHRQMGLLQTLSTSAQTLQRWVMVSDSQLSDIAGEVKQTVRAKYSDEEHWLNVAKPLRDQIREQQRDALVAQLVYSLDLQGPNALYDHFLIDVEMDPCMLTTRLALAISSVQLFTQRCLLNLEAVVFSPKDADEWSWMQHYREWEVARKGFVYTENFLRPDLPNGKSEQFHQMERDLLQGEVDETSAEHAFSRYLNDLGQVARLKITATTRQWDVHQDILHVFGRSRSVPRVHYYRRWVDKRYWTPWTRIELDIDDDMVVPAIWQNRLFLFWPIFTEKALETVAEGDEVPPPPKRYYSIQMAWSEYRNGEWLPTQFSENAIRTPAAPKLVSRSQIRFWPQLGPQDHLYIVSSGSQAQFRLDACGCQLSANRKILRRWVPFPRLAASVGSPFQGTGFDHGRLLERSHAGTSQPLIVFSSGDRHVESGYEYLTVDKQSLLLNETPGQFEVTLPIEEPLFVSRSPFFYSDRRSCFLVVPRGRYTGGYVNPDLGFVNTVTPTHGPPMELPDTVTHIVASAVAPVALPVLANEVVGEDNGPEAQGVLLTNHMLHYVISPLQWEARAYRFENHYHPFVTLLIKQLERHGIGGVLKPDPEKEPQRAGLMRSLRRQRLIRLFFVQDYQPNLETVENVQGLSGPLELAFVDPVEEFDFSYSGAYAGYNWELFFHVPLLLALRLSENQQFAAAQRWFHYIFDPTDIPEESEDTPWPDHVWQIKPFFEQGRGKPIQDAMLLLSAHNLSGQELQQRKRMREQIEAWRKEPYRLDLLAQMRPQTSMKAVVMAYLDNLIAWADQLFRMDTRESLNQATQLLLLAEKILGERPVEISANQDARRTINGEEVRTFNQLRAHLDDFSNALVLLESQLDPQGVSDTPGGASQWVATNDLAFAPAPDDTDDELQLIAPGVETPDDNPDVVDLPLANPIPAVLGPTLFFCVPKNDKLLGYWDLVADRLYKLRHCLNLDGVLRQVPPFAPAIDPDRFFAASASGLGVGDLQQEAQASLPKYRFQVLAQKASEMIGETKSLGAALLSAVEKKESETLALIRAGHEVSLLERIEQVRVKQHQEAIEQKAALLESRHTVITRYQHYERMLGNRAASVPVGTKILMRNTSTKVSFENVSPADFESTDDEIGGLGVDLSKVVESIVDGIVAKTPLGKVRKKLEKIKPFKRIPGLKKIGNFLDGLPTAGEFLADTLPLKTVTLDDFIDLLGGQDTAATVSPDEFLKGLDALRMLLQEKGELRLMSEAQRFNKGAANMRISAARWHQVPTATLSVAPIGIGVSTSIGGTNIASAATASGERLNAQSSDLSLGANLSARVSHYILRENDWILQRNVTAREVMALDRQLITADVRISIAERELASHRKQMSNARDIEKFLSDKYTTEELYSWLSLSISDIYFESYKLAFDLAKRAERAFRFELGITDSEYTKYGYWDSLKKGLLAGEKLYQDLKRMEVAYLEEQRSDFELTKHISLNMLNPHALLRLKEQGRCEIELPEALFDWDYPGHYFRRIKSVSITIPAVTGPYTTVACTLRLLRSTLRRQSTLTGGQYVRDLDNDDPRFSDTFGAIQSIATSSGQNDSGLFELNFRDERYLPFEGAGVISRWQLEMANEFRQFDYDTISDVVLHIRYTARDGGAALRLAASTSLLDAVNAMMAEDNAPGLHLALSARHDFSTEFHRFLHPSDDNAEVALSLDLSRNRFPYLFQDRDIRVEGVDLFVRLSQDHNGESFNNEFALVAPDDQPPMDMTAASDIGNLRQFTTATIESTPGEWQLLATSRLDDPGVVEDMVFVVHYRLVQ